MGFSKIAMGQNPRRVPGLAKRARPAEMIEGVKGKLSSVKAEESKSIDYKSTGNSGKKVTSGKKGRPKKHG